MSRRKRADYRALDGILLVDKPFGRSSNQVLQQVRHIYKAHKAGHTGNLDPLATGMLPICFGQATKLSGLLLDSNKTYVARARLGQKTATGDAEGDVIETSDPSALQYSDFEQILPRFTGEISQVPPMYSALKHEGRRLYQIARAGQEVERDAREVTIFNLKILSFEDGHLEVSVRCSKGTYIRTLLEDMAAAVGQCAHLSALRRTEVDPFANQPMRTMESLESVSELGLEALDALMQPMLSAIPDWPQLTLPEAVLDRLAHGQPMLAPEDNSVPLEVDLALLDPRGRLCAIGRRTAEGQILSKKWLAGGEST